MYNYLLALIVGITREARRHVEVAESKAKREGTPMPSTKFVYNRFALQLEQNKMLNEFMETQKKSWDEHPEFLKKIYIQITESQIYKDYMESADDDRGTTILNSSRKSTSRLRKARFTRIIWSLPMTII